MRHTVLGVPSSLKGFRFRRDWDWAAARRELAHDTRVMMRRESQALIDEALAAEFEPQRDFDAEWRQAVSERAFLERDAFYGEDWEQRVAELRADKVAQREEDAAQAHFFETGEFLPV